MNAVKLSGGLCVLIFATGSYASVESIGPNGINSQGLLTANGLPLNGGAIGSVNPVAIGQVEIFRPGDPNVDTNTALTNSAVNPTSVFFVNPGTPPTFTPTPNSATELGPAAPNAAGQHALLVAGVIISTATATPPTANTPTGVATAAQLYSAGIGSPPDNDQWTAVAMQHLAAELPGVDVRAINYSAGFVLDPGASPDGNSILTSFIDWSASKHDVLYVASGAQASAAPIPSDNFNGMTVAASAQVGGTGVYDRISIDNNYAFDASGERTSIDIMAPGLGVGVTLRNNQQGTAAGTSVAAPHVAGTVALLQQYANERIVNAGWNAVNSRRHEVMKAVLMNSADKIIDDGTFMIPGDALPAPVGTFLGMERTVLDYGPAEDGVNRQNWLQSEAYGDSPFSDPSFIPLDNQMGAGHLNAKRAVQQFAPGEQDSDGSPVSVIGWDYGHTSGLNDNNKYVISQPLLGGSFISVTMAWDRSVTLNDTNSNGLFDHGETFEPYTSFPPSPHADDVINDLDLYLVPIGMTMDDAVAASLSNDSTIEHMFFRIPTTGQYELWVNQFDADIAGGQDYAIAWWAASANLVVEPGDYNGDQVVDAQDYAVWRDGFGSTVTAGTGADGNSDGVIDAADYVIWRKNLSGAGAGSGLASVPEPSSMILLVAASVLLTCRRSGRAVRVASHLCSSDFVSAGPRIYSNTD